MLIQTDQPKLINILNKGLFQYIHDRYYDSEYIKVRLEVRLVNNEWIIHDNKKYFITCKEIIDILIYLQERIESLLEQDVYQNGLSVQLHGGTLYGYSSKKGIGIIGPTQAGKSSLITGAVLSQEFSFVSDDSILFQQNTKLLKTFPQMLFLRNKGLFNCDADRYCFAQGYSNLREENVYAFSFPHPECPVFLSYIVFLQRNEERKPFVARLSSIEGYEELLLNSKFGTHVSVNRMCFLEIVRTIPIYRLNYTTIKEGIYGLLKIQALI